MLILGRLAEKYSLLVHTQKHDIVAVFLHDHFHPIYGNLFGNAGHANLPHAP